MQKGAMFHMSQCLISIVLALCTIHEFEKIISETHEPKFIVIVINSFFVIVLQNKKSLRIIKY